jgi:hypothetical protein
MVNPFRKATVTVTGRHGSADIPLPAPMLQCVSDARLRAQVLEIARKDYREQSVGGVTVPELCRRWSLHEACVEGHPFFVGVRLAIYVALSKSKDVNFLISGRTLLWTAIRYGHYNLIRILLRVGVDPNISDGYGRTPLHLASKAGSADSIRILLDAGVEPNVQDNDEVTPLHFAVTHLGSEQGALEAAKLLLEAGADPSLKTNKGACAISVAVARGWDDMIELFRGRCPEQVAGYWFDAA